MSRADKKPTEKQVAKKKIGETQTPRKTRNCRPRKYDLEKSARNDSEYRKKIQENAQRETEKAQQDFQARKAKAAQIAEQARVEEEARNNEVVLSYRRAVETATTFIAGHTAQESVDHQLFGPEICSVCHPIQNDEFLWLLGSFNRPGR